MEPLLTKYFGGVNYESNREFKNVVIEGSIRSKLTNVSFSLWWRLVISIIHWKNVLLDLAVPAHQRKCASLAQRKGGLSCGYSGTPLQG